MRGKLCGAVRHCKRVIRTLQRVRVWERNSWATMQSVAGNTPVAERSDELDAKCVV